MRFGIVDEAKRESTSDTCETLSYLYSKSFDADAQRMTPNYRRNDYSVTGINWKKENGDNQGMQDTCFSGSINFYKCQNDQEEAFVLHFDILRSQADPDLRFSVLKGISDDKDSPDPNALLWTDVPGHEKLCSMYVRVERDISASK